MVNKDIKFIHHHYFYKSIKKIGRVDKNGKTFVYNYERYVDES